MVKTYLVHISHDNRKAVAVTHRNLKDIEAISVLYAACSTAINDAELLGSSKLEIVVKQDQNALRSAEEREG